MLINITILFNAFILRINACVCETMQTAVTATLKFHIHEHGCSANPVKMLQTHICLSHIFQAQCHALLMKAESTCIV